MTLPAIFALSGPALGDDERAFFRAADPAGYILFARNVRDPDQLRALADDLRALAGRDGVPIMVDQEGGRVARLAPPHWPRFPAAGAFGRLYEIAPMSAIEAVRANGQAIGLLLREAGLNVDCAPVLDLTHEGAHAIVGDRSFGADPLQVAALGRAMLDGLAAAGVAGCIKHVPGHGRCSVDSHSRLPLVDTPREALERDFAPFHSLRLAPFAMVAHAVYSALDPDRAASRSPIVIGETIRGEIGFEGVLVSDDIGMGALSGSPGERARDVVAAGCDLALHCSGDLAEMEAVAGSLRAMDAAAVARLAAAAAAAESAVSSYEALAEKRDLLLGLSAAPEEER